jgi:plastocyanin
MLAEILLQANRTASDTVQRSENAKSYCNHNGNARDMKGPYHYGFDWVIPQGLAQADKPAKCVIRLRYNMSSSDYDNWNTFSWGNFDKKVIENNPRVVDPVKTLQLTINTNQVGRTFQDRSHAFFIHSRKDLYDKIYNKYGTEYPETRVINDNTVIHNLNVRGKRGNIVQTYPAVEYDFTPNVLNIKKGDFVHFQWTGSNNNPKNYAGQGTAGTDRSNIMQMTSLKDNIPLPMNETNLWGDMNSVNWQERENARKLYYLFALLGQHDPLLNDADPYFNFPPVQFTSAGTYHYLCSRNNNFSNRSQKGTIVVADK